MRHWTGARRLHKPPTKSVKYSTSDSTVGKDLPDLPTNPAFSLVIALAGANVQSFLSYFCSPASSVATSARATYAAQSTQKKGVGGSVLQGMRTHQGKVHRKVLAA